MLSRTSHEVRGLKCDRGYIRRYRFKSHLTRGAWIEISSPVISLLFLYVAPHTRCVD